jgi:hypothetical protein
MRIIILCKAPGKVEVKMSLNETDWWLWKKSETTCGTHSETDNETDSKTFNETCKK